MRFIRRLADRRSSRAFVVFSSATIAAAVWSCGSDDAVEPTPDPSSDASPDVAPPADAGMEEDVRGPRDAGFIDAAPPAIVCAGGPCAVALVTSSTGNADNYDEGFCALMKDGHVACWGTNVYGQLGRGDDAGDDDSATPAHVVGLSNVASLHHTCAVDEDGAAFCWGTGPFAVNGTAVTKARTPVRLPIPAASHVDATRDTACAVIGDTVRCWGSNYNAQVGPLTTMARQGWFEPTIVPLTGTSPIRDLAVSRATLITRANGTTESWGANPPLGRQSPLFPDPYSQPISVWGISSVDLADENACAAAGGVGYCWGRVIPNFTERLPPALDLTNTLPVAVSTPEPIVQISTTVNVIKYDFGAPLAQRQRWCAVGLSGAVLCWGNNASGQAGDGTKDHAFEPVKVAGLPGPAAQVKTAPDSTCALLTSGKVYCWGSNYYGQLGNGNIRQPSVTPQEVVLP